MRSPSDDQYLIAELSHQINSPLAAIRNALYLVACRTDDPEVLRYLSLADQEISVIASALRATRTVLEPIAEPPPEQVVTTSASRRRAAPLLG